MAFADGYQAALEDLSGAMSMERASIMYADPFVAAMESFYSFGEDWLAPRVQEYLDNFTVRRDDPVRSPRRARAGTVYVFGDEPSTVKIGWTAGDVDARRRSVEKASGRTLVVIATTPGSMVVEREFHERFAADRLHGEWFTRSAAIDAWIETL
jgi:hypothetical protein